jgi:hypothetical protein
MKSRYHNASWWDWLNYTWTQDIFDVAMEGKPITLEQLGGINNDESLRERSKRLGEAYDSQPEG